MRNPRTVFILILLIGLTAPTWAGEIHVPDNLPAQGTCNVFPWGTSTEWRYQAVVPASMMGSKAARISELAFTPCGTGTFSSPKCEIRMAHLSKAYTTTFQNNLEKDVTLVFSGALSFNYTANQWSDVGLTTAFTYNGVDSLVVEVRYVGRTGGSSFHRGATIPRLYTSGTGAFTSTTATGSDLAALKMRFTTVDVLISGSGSPTPGGTVNLDLLAPADGGLAYQVGSSLGTGPIQLGNRQLNLSADDLLVVSVSGLLPTVFVNFAGKLDQAGKAKASINILNDARLKGVRIHSAFVTLDLQSPFGIKSISNTFTFTIQ